ncbi:hypothetical protein LZ30DRAFT_821202 [Colletotrichum cereale]|nr:hypothetical protein LZ30DRAFT_821202 [Colletotrichum cereale]
MEAKLLDSCSDEPDTKTAIKPEYISQFNEGKLEPRYGLFKDAFFHEASMPKGNISVAIKFADFLTSNSPTPPKNVTPGAFHRLPEPSKDIEKVKRDIKEFGFGLAKNALTPEYIIILKKATQEQAARERKAGVSAVDGGPNAPTSVFGLLSTKVFKTSSQIS